MATSTAVAAVVDNIRAIADDFAGAHRERQLRREQVRDDFDRLARAGFLLSGVPMDHGGLWEDVPRTGPLVASCCAVSPMVIPLSLWCAQCIRRRSVSG